MRTPFHNAPKVVAAIGTSFAFFAAAAAPAQEPTGVTALYPAGSIHSPESADAALADVLKERASVEANYAKEQQACYGKFFATSCLNKAKDGHRHAMQQLRSIEIEANEFKRRARVDERDAALATKREQEEAEQPERERRQQEHVDGMQQREAEKARSANNAPPAGKAKTSSSAPNRTAEHEARLKQIHAEEAAKASERAENISAYEKKVKEAEARQKEVAERKAAKEEQRRAKEAAQPTP